MTKDEIIAKLKSMAKYPAVTLPRDTEALRLAASLLEQSTEQEPVAWMDIDGNIDCGLDAILNPDGYRPLYTTPPQHALMAEHWKAEYDKLKAASKPLTDEQIKKDFEKWAKENYVQGFEPYGDSYHNGHTRNRWQGWLAAHRAIEAAHDIKE